MASAFRRLYDLFLPIAVLASIGVVIALTDWNGRTNAETETLEQRQVAVLPPAPRSLPALYHYSAEFSHFFDDHYGLRQRAIDLRARIWFWLLDDVVSPDVIAGRDHWLFFTANKELADTLHADPLPATALKAWAEGIEQRRRWLAARGIRYLFVLAPDKRTIYPEKLPRLHPGPGPTRREQVDSQLAGQEAFLDLTNSLRADKHQGQLYYRWDTHWNWRGAYDGYRVIMGRLGLPPEPESLGAPTQHLRHMGDLGRMSGLRLFEDDHGPNAPCVRPDPSPPDPAFIDNYFHTSAKPYLVPGTVCASGTGTLLMFHDSFGAKWAPWLSAHFARATYVWRQPSFAELKRMVEIEHPTVVIEERLERFLIWPLRP